MYFSIRKFKYDRLNKLMSEKYKIREKEKAYFTTLTIVGCIDVFTRANHKMAIVNSLKHCIENKGLMIFAWCLMPGHRRAEGKVDLSDILRDFKTFTSKKIISQVKEEPENRREWMLEFFARECSHLKRNQAYKVWQDGNPLFRICNPGVDANRICNTPIKKMNKSWIANLNGLVQKTPI